MTEPVSDDQAVANLQAQRIMYELLGHRWVWPAVTTTEVVTVYPGMSHVSLQGRPITDIEYVRRVGDERFLSHVIESSHRVRLLEQAPQAPHSTQRSWACAEPTRMEVRYTYGSPPPAPVVKAIETLSAELLKAIVGDRTCKLPERVTSVTREGLTMALIDPQDFLDKGRTGLVQVDMVLSTYNPGGVRRRAKVVGRATPLGVRIAPPTSI